MNRLRPEKIEENQIKLYPSKHFLFSKTSSRRLEDVFRVTLFLFQDVLKTSSARLHQDECLLECCYHVTYEFQRESTLYSLPECQGTILAQIRRHIWSLNDSNEIRTHNHLVRKRTLNHLVKLAFFFFLASFTFSIFGQFG